MGGRLLLFKGTVHDIFYFTFKNRADNVAQLIWVVNQNNRFLQGRKERVSCIIPPPFFSGVSWSKIHLRPIFAGHCRLEKPLMTLKYPKILAYCFLGEQWKNISRLPSSTTDILTTNDINLMLFLFMYHLVIIFLLRRSKISILGITISTEHYFLKYFNLKTL